MTATNKSPITVRDAAESDIPALTAIKGNGSEAIHLDRLHDAESSGFRYLVVLIEQAVIGFACLVSVRPTHWSDTGDTQNLPQIVDLQVEELYRGKGYGSAFIHAMERIAAEAGYSRLYLSVEPLSNPRAYALYQRLDYHPLQTEPYLKTWAFQDSGGKMHGGEDWLIDMVKQLTI